MSTDDSHYIRRGWNTNTKAVLKAVVFRRLNLEMSLRLGKMLRTTTCYSDHEVKARKSINCCSGQIV